MLVTVEAFQGDLALAEQMIDLDARGNCRLKESNATLTSCRGVCARCSRIAVTAARPWPTQCEALVIAFASNTKIRLDQKMFGL